MIKKQNSPSKFNDLLNDAIKFQNSGHFLEAQSIYFKLKEVQPENSNLLFLLGSLYGQMGDFENCINSLTKSLELSPDQIDTYNNLAIAYELTNQLDSAIQTYNKALTLSPNSPLIHGNLGDLYRKTGNFEKSLQHLDECLTLSPGNENALLYKANLFGEMKKTDEAKHIYKQALALYPENSALLCNYSALLLLDNSLDDAETLVRKAIQINPNYPQALSNLGNILIKREEFIEGENCLLKAIEINPSFSESYINLGFLYHNTARFDEALTKFNQAIELDPESGTGHWYRSFTQLLTGKFESAWDDYEYGLKGNERIVTDFHYPAYQPEAINQGQSILITAEQGIGDQIMFSTCLREFIKQSNKVVLECDKRLVPLFRRSFPSIEVIHTKQYDATSLPVVFPQIQQKISIGSLPRLFRRSLDAFPKKIPGLTVDIEKHIKWKKRYQLLGKKLKVGISWQGGIKSTHKTRSMKLVKWRDVLQCDCDFINLQYGDHSEEIKSLEDSSGIIIHDWEDSDSLKEIDDFSAQISALDLVISVGNTNVHLAGSLNIPTWCLIPQVPSWRWLFTGDQCLWYPTVKIYRQKKLHEWEQTLQAVKRDLEIHISENSNQ